MDVEQEEWLTHALQDYERKRCISKVLSTESSEAVQKGSNYGSDMYRLLVKVVTNEGLVQNRHYICKVLPKSEHRRIGLKKSGLYFTETRMYLETLPEMESILKEKEPGTEALWPICYGVKRGNQAYLLQDLCALGFSLADRMTGMDYKHASLAIKSLAKFHALSAVGIERADISVSDYSCYTLAKSKELVSVLLGKSFVELATTIENNWGSEWSDYSKKVELFGQRYPELLVESFKRDDTKFNILNHGDCWINNIMFNYSPTGEPKSVRFIDFQLAHINGPGFDIQYFFNTSLHYNIFSRKQELIQEYHDSLVENLKLFGFAGAVPSLEDILDSYKKAAVFGLGAGLTFRPLMMIPSQDAPDMEEVAKAYTSGQQKSMSRYDYDGQVFLNTLKTMLKEGSANGIL